jgi:hypothetical protein
MAVRVVDYSPLTAPVSPQDVAAWRAQAKASGAPWAGVNASVIATIVVGAVVVLITVNITFGIAVAGAGAGTGSTFTVPLILAVIAVLVIIAVRASRRGGGKWVRWVRLSRFAQANGMTFSPMQGNPSYPGEIFQLGRDRTALDHLTTASGRFLDLGNFRWITGSGKNQTTHTWGFLALSLDRKMPNIVLDSKANNSIFGSNLPASLDRNQVLHLEGDFDRYFTLYCPTQYEQDALYIFTPDLMALLIDEAAPFDVELVDDWMFVYASHPFDMTETRGCCSGSSRSPTRWAPRRSTRPSTTRMRASATSTPTSCRCGEPASSAGRRSSPSWPAWPSSPRSWCSGAGSSSERSCAARSSARGRRRSPPARARARRRAGSARP